MNDGDSLKGETIPSISKFSILYNTIDSTKSM